jgi:pyruvate dehydrogenase E2 component (dihydrolipoamide acetyltransferase)
MGVREFLLPDLGEGLEDAEIVAWRVSVGDAVVVDQPLLEVETAKANVEIPCPFEGTVAVLHAQPGDRIDVGALLVTIEVGAATGLDTPERSDEAPSEPPAAGRGESDHVQGSAPARPLVGLGARDDASTSTRTVPSRDLAPVSNRSHTETRVRATPPVRKRAHDLGIDLSAVTATGRDGVVTHHDLNRHLEGQSGSTVPRESTTVPVRGIRRAVAEKMVTSRREIPDASTWVDCDATHLLEVRTHINQAQIEVKVTPLALVLRACVAALERFPRLNARYDAEREEIEELRAVHLGVAVQTDNGLVVPVIRDAQNHTTLGIASELHRLAAGARASTLAPAELVGSTFTVSNYGAFGVDGGAAIINHPEAAILGVGRFANKPWVVDGRVVVRSIVELSLSFDHRIMDGNDAAGFLRFIADCVERPSVLLAHT